MLLVLLLVLSRLEPHLVIVLKKRLRHALIRERLLHQVLLGLEVRWELLLLLRLLILLLLLLLRLLSHWVISVSRLENLRWCLWNCSPASHCFYLLNLQILIRLSLSFLTVPFVLFVDVEDQFLHQSTCCLVLVIVAGRDAQMQRFVGFFLSRAFFES